VRKRSIALALCCALVCSPASAKTKPFVGVLWPMFGPFLAVGLVELVAELKMRPDIEVRTYLHQNWPTLVEDLNHLPKETRTLVVGYSLGANSTVFVANKVDYIDSIIALQPSMLSWNPDLKGKVGRIVEIYNPKPEETLGGMGSKKLVGDNIEYIVNSDTHMGTQFGSDFRDLVKSEIARLAALDDRDVEQTTLPQPPAPSTLVAASDPNQKPTGPQANPLNAAKAADGAQAKSQPHCDVTGSVRPAQGKKPDDLTQKVIDAQSAESRHYGSIEWQAATQKKPDALTQKIIDSALCSE
jgi:hypothetical protein